MSSSAYHGRCVRTSHALGPSFLKLQVKNRAENEEQKGSKRLRDKEKKSRVASGKQLYRPGFIVAPVPARSETERGRVPRRV